MLLDDLRARDGFDDELPAAFLAAACGMRANLVVSRRRSPAKLTLLRALGNAIPFDERIVTAETSSSWASIGCRISIATWIAMEERLRGRWLLEMTLLDLVRVKPGA